MGGQVGVPTSPTTAKGRSIQLTQPEKGRAESGNAAPLLELAGTFRLLADPTRLRILDTLRRGVQCNCNIKAMLGLPMNLISHHLKVLKDAGLVRAERDPDDARWIYYEIDPGTLESLRTMLWAALDPARLRPRMPFCGPSGCCLPDVPAPKTRAPADRIGVRDDRVLRSCPLHARSRRGR